MIKKLVWKANYFADPGLVCSMVGAFRNIIIPNSLALMLIILGLFSIILTNTSYAYQTNIKLNLNFEDITVDDVQRLWIWNKNLGEWMPNNDKYDDPDLNGEVVNINIDSDNLFKPFKLDYAYQTEISQGVLEFHEASAYGVLLRKRKGADLYLNPGERYPYRIMFFKPKGSELFGPLGKDDIRLIPLNLSSDVLDVSYDENTKSFKIKLSGEDNKYLRRYPSIQFQISKDGPYRGYEFTYSLRHPRTEVVIFPEAKEVSRKNGNAATPISRERPKPQQPLGPERWNLTIIDDRGRPLRRIQLEAHGTPGWIGKVWTDDNGQFVFERRTFPGVTRIKLVPIGHHRDWLSIPNKWIQLSTQQSTIDPIKVGYKRKQIAIILKGHADKTIVDKSHAWPRVFWTPAFEAPNKGKRRELDGLQRTNGKWVFAVEGAKDDLIEIRIQTDKNRYGQPLVPIRPMSLLKANTGKQQRIHKINLKSLIKTSELNISFQTKKQGRIVKRKLPRKRAKAWFVGPDGKESAKTLTWDRKKKRYTTTIKHQDRKEVRIKVKAFGKYATVSVLAQLDGGVQSIELNLAKPILFIAWDPNLRLIKKKLRKKGVLRHTTALTNFVNGIYPLSDRHQWSYLHVADVNKDGKFYEILSDIHGRAIQWDEKTTDGLKKRIRQRVLDGTSVSPNKIIEPISKFANGFSYGPKATRAHLIYVLEEPTTGISNDDLIQMETLLRRQRMSATILQLGHTDGEELKILTGGEKKQFQRLQFVQADITKSFHNDYFFSAFDRAAKLVAARTKRRSKQEKIVLAAQLAEATSVKARIPRPKQVSKLTKKGKAKEELIKRIPKTPYRRSYQADEDVGVFDKPTGGRTHLGELKKGDIVKAIFTTEDGIWLKIKWKGKDAYVKIRYLSAVQTPKVKQVQKANVKSTKSSVKHRPISALVFIDGQPVTDIKDFAHISFTRPNGSFGKKQLKHVGYGKFDAIIEHKLNTDVKIHIGEPFEVRSYDANLDRASKHINVKYRKRRLTVYIDLGYSLAPGSTFTRKQKHELRYAAAQFVCRAHKLKRGALWNNIQILSYQETKSIDNYNYKIVWNSNYIDQWIQNIPVTFGSKPWKASFLLQQIKSKYPQNPAEPDVFIYIAGQAVRDTINEFDLLSIDTMLERNNLKGLIIKLGGRLYTASTILPASEKPMNAASELGPYQRLDYILADAQQAFRVNKLNDVFEAGLQALAARLGIPSTKTIPPDCPKRPLSKTSVSKNVKVTPKFQKMADGPWFAYGLWNVTSLYTKSNPNSSIYYLRGPTRLSILAKSKDGAWLKIYHKQLDRFYYVKTEDTYVVHGEYRTQNKKNRSRSFPQNRIDDPRDDGNAREGYSD